MESGRPTTRDCRGRLVALLEAAEPDGWEDDEEMSDGLVELLDSVFLDSVPIARRLVDLLEERGWRGWTKLERIGRT